MKLKLLVLVLALQTAWILGTTFVQERALAGGQVVLLETRPVDPRDLLRGDYVTLNYKISDVTLSPPPAPSDEVPSYRVPPGTTIYVALEQRGQFHEVVLASTNRITPAAGQVVLKGRCQSWWNHSAGSKVHVAYGLERYYVREGTGNPRGKLTVQAAVPDSGQARIKEVLVDGRPYAEAMKGMARQRQTE
jgi:uncharacterized membrane-anchored protein